MKKLLFLIVFIVSGSTLLSNAKPKASILNRCYALKQIRIAALKNLQKLEEEANDGNISSALALYKIWVNNNDGSNIYMSEEVQKKLKAIDYVDGFGNVLPIIHESLSEEVYNECKEAFESTEE